MENQPNQPQAVQQPVTTMPPAAKSHTMLLTFMSLLVVLLIAAVAGMYVWQHDKVKSLSGQLTAAQAAAQKSRVSNTSTSTSSATPTTATDTLPDGTKVTYPLTAGNANVVWWTDGNDAPAPQNEAADGFMRVTDKRVIEFLSTIPTDTIQKLCTSEWDNETGFNMGLYDTKGKTLTLHNQYQNCIDAVAADSGGKYAAQAQQVAKDSANDLNAWAKSLTVSK